MPKKQIYINLDDIIIRPWKIEDAGDLVFHANNLNISKNLRDAFPHPYTLADAHKWLDKNLHEDNNDATGAITIDNHIIGGIGLHPMDDVYRYNAELGYWLSEQYWNRGIMTKTVKAICAYTFENFETHRIFAGVFENNPASEKLLLNAGFTKEATLKQSIFKNGVFLSEHLYSLLKTDVV